jgi:hypothetical protein
MATIEIDGFDAVQRLLDGLSGRGIEQVMQSAALKIAQEARNRIMRYPGPSNSPVKWASRKQQMWYFAMRRKRGLDAKYTRISDPMSQKLRQSWAVEKAGSTGAVVGTRVTYAPYVQGQDDQQPQHKATGWETEKDAVENLKARNVVERIVMAELDSYVKGLK